MEYFAHTRKGVNPSEWQSLAAHLIGTANRARSFASPFHSGDWGYLAGLWHDLGKFDPRFQARLFGSRITVDHSVVGAALAVSRFGNMGWHAAFPIAGHHAGMADLRGDEPPTQLATRVTGYLNNGAIFGDLPAELAGRALPVLPSFLHARESNRTEHPARLRSTEFWIRFIFSALVDADWLDTENFLRPSLSPARAGYSNIADLSQCLRRYLAAKVSALSEAERSTRVNRARAEVLKHCERAAELPPGIFSLTAPTGAGKTLSSMAFALNHAKKHGLRRVISVLPYTSIIEQNAAVYRAALGDAEVVEHHSSLDLDELKTLAGEEAADRHALASENWDAPVIVTTTVQFFESLFSNRPARCRKLHNIARSVVILDEVQALPSGFLLSILDGLNELVANYGCSILLSTATPPALGLRDGFPLGLSRIHEVLPDPKQVARDLNRVVIHWPRAEEPARNWVGLADEIAREPLVMAIVHRRADARELASAVKSARPDEAVFHLSALMCAAHRQRALDEVKRALHGAGPCRLIATQLVEAGVDIDFPVVWRALCGLDSIVQAAGRCNREGRLDSGHVFVFRAPSSPPSGTPRKAHAVALAMLREGSLDLSDPQVFDIYFRRLYMLDELDRNQVQCLRQECRFASVARAFRLIEDGHTRAVVVPYGDSGDRIARLRQDGLTRESLRALQRYLVSVPISVFEHLSRRGALEEAAPGITAVKDSWSLLYDDRFGLQTDLAAIDGRHCESTNGE